MFDDIYIIRNQYINKLRLNKMLASLVVLAFLKVNVPKAEETFMNTALSVEYICFSVGEFQSTFSVFAWVFAWKTNVYYK